MTLSEWADLSIILLAIEAFVISLVPALILFYCVKGMLRLLRELRRVFPIVRGYFLKAEQITKKTSDQVAAPFITASATAAQTRRWQQSLIASLRTKQEV
jgi:hypothetical protein